MPGRLADSPHAAEGIFCDAFLSMQVGPGSLSSQERVVSVHLCPLAIGTPIGKRQKCVSTDSTWIQYGFNMDSILIQPLTSTIRRALFRSENERQDVTIMAALV